MSYSIIGIFTNASGLIGSYILTIFHGLVSSSLFFLIGFLYDRYKTRLIYYYRSLTTIMPIFSSIFFILTLANIGFPGTSNFVAEMLIFQSIFTTNIIVSIFCLFALFFTAIFGFWIYTRVCMGTYTNDLHIPIKYYTDLNRREFLIILWPIILIFLFGIKPQLLITICESSLYEIFYTKI
jgi:NADH-quinone oxidoreductase subunit M